MRKGWLFSGLAALVLGSVLWAKTGEVHLKDGRVYTGEVDDSQPESVIVTLHGVQEVFDRQDVDTIDYPGPIDQQYADRMDRLGDHDVAGRLAVAAWIRDQGRYDLARRAVAEALAIDPTNAQAKEMMHDISIEAALHRGGAAPVKIGATTQPAPTSFKPRPYLSDDDINQIRQTELRADESFKVSFVHDVKKRFLDLGRTDVQVFNNLTPDEQARLILDEGAPAMAADVRIDSDPASMAEYHDRVQARIIGGCTLSGCHSAELAPGGFGLFTGDESPQAWYTNYYILQTYVQAAAGELGQGKFMIDRVHPEKSLVLEYGLPPAMAASPHPAAPNFYQRYSGRNDPHYLLIAHWIADVLKPDAGVYPGIHYRPPWAAATMHPAAK